MKKLRSALTALSALALAMVMTACSSGDSNEQSTAGESTVTTIEPGVLTVGVPTFPPFIGLDGDTITGPDGDIINELAELNGLTVKAVPYGFSALIPAVQQGRVDLALGSIFRTEVRAEAVDFTDPLYIEPGAIISKDGISNVDDLVGKRVGTVQGYNWVDDVNKVLGGDLKQYPSSSELQQDLEQGRLDAAIDSNGTVLYLYKDTDFQVNVIEPSEKIAASTNPGQTAIILKKGNTELADALNESIATLHDNGFIADALEKAELDPTAAEVGEPAFL